MHDAAPVRVGERAQSPSQDRDDLGDRERSVGERSRSDRPSMNGIV
jgi:hypothetical protein